MLVVRKNNDKKIKIGAHAACPYYAWSFRVSGGVLRLFAEKYHQ